MEENTMWILYLNHMMASGENLTPVARSENKERLTQFLQQEAVAPYKDGQWHKAYRNGGPLEWYNPPIDDYHIINIGTLEDWLGWSKILYEIPELGVGDSE